jgi:hypothetical protein
VLQVQQHELKIQEARIRKAKAGVAGCVRGGFREVMQVAEEECHQADIEEEAMEMKVKVKMAPAKSPSAKLQRKMQAVSSPPPDSHRQHHHTACHTNPLNLISILQLTDHEILKHDAANHGR